MKWKNFTGIAIASILVIVVMMNSCAKSDRYAKVDSSKCTLCKQCLTVCSYHAITYVTSSDSTVSDKVVIDPQKCVGCGECVKNCPSKAISFESE